MPPELERIVRRCLEKAPPNRFQSADDLAFALEAVTLDPDGGGDGRRRCPAAHARAVAAGRHRRARDGRVAAGGGLVRESADASIPARTGSRRLRPGPDTPNDPVWSPDGRSIAYDMSVNGRSQIFVRSLDSDSPAQITHDVGRCGPAVLVAGWQPRRLPVRRQRLVGEPRRRRAGARAEGCGSAPPRCLRTVRRWRRGGPT